MKTVWAFVEPFAFALLIYWGWYKLIFIHQHHMDQIDAAVATVLIIVSIFGFRIHNQLKDAAKG